MSQYSYFSDYDNGEGKYLEPIIWEAIKGYFDNFFLGEAFSKNFPDSYNKTNQKAFMHVLKGEVSEVTSIKQILQSKEIETGELEKDSFSDEQIPITKRCYSLHSVMDFISFLYGNINQDRKKEFQSSINRVFQRNNLNFELTEDGKIIRTVSPFFEKAFVINFIEDDTVLNGHLNIAYEKFQSIDLCERKIALKELWDAFEKITSSKASHEIPILIKKVICDDSKSDSISNEANKIKEIFNYLYKDAKKESEKLKQIGNQQNIRHSNEKQNPLDNSDYVDYLFYRMSATIHLLLIELNKEKSNKS
jgi:hypothetical protein